MLIIVIIIIVIITNNLLDNNTLVITITHVTQNKYIAPNVKALAFLMAWCIFGLYLYIKYSIRNRR